WWDREFSREHDHFRLLGQDNLRRYRAFREVRVRITPADDLFEVLVRCAAARVTGARVIASFARSVSGELMDRLNACTEAWAAAIECLEETDDELASWLRALHPHATERLRYAAPGRVPAVVREAAAEAGQYVADEPVSVHGRVELLACLREQSLSFDYHRYGNLGARASEPRHEPD